MQMRQHCIDNAVDAIDISDSDYAWRLLLKTITSHSKKRLIGPGITGIAFRLLNTIDPNYEPGGPYQQIMHEAGDTCAGDRGRRHVFEINSANGDMWHTHFHWSNDVDLEHFPFLDIYMDNEDTRRKWTECCVEA